MCAFSKVNAYEETKNELLFCKVDAPREYQDIDEFIEVHGMGEQRVEHKCLQDRSAVKPRGFREYAEQFQFFELQEGGARQAATRCVFGVVPGSSQPGKTLWVKQVFGARRTLFKDCQHQAAPRMHGLRRRHVTELSLARMRGCLL